MIRRWLLSLLEADVRALVRDEVDLYLLDLGLDDRLDVEDETLAKARLDAWLNGI